MAKDILGNKGPKNALKRPVEALSWVREGQSSLKRVGGLESWPFPTFKGQPLEPKKYLRQSRVYPDGPDALM